MPQSSENEDIEPSQPRGFTAFISYSQKDWRLAKRLHLSLKAYRVPKGIDAPGLGKGRTLGRLFRDDENMGADASLGEALDKLIDSSRNLIVLCTPSSAQSQWVEKEIRRFKRRRHPGVFAVIAKGQPNSNIPSTECFSPALKVKFDPAGNPTGEADEPLAPDLQKESFSKVQARLVAGLMGIPFDDLWRHDLRRRRRRKVLRATLVASLALVLWIALLETDRVFDASALAVQSVQISSDAWRRGSDDEVFHRAFRAALAANPLPGSIVESNGAEEHCNLNEPIRTGICALALSGHALAHIYLLDEQQKSPRGNFRDDIPGAVGIERRAVRLNEYVRAVTFSGDSNRVGLIHMDGRLIIYDIARRQVVFEQVIAKASYGPIALDERGQLALVGDRDHKLIAVDLESSRKESFTISADIINDLKIAGPTWLAVETQNSKNESSVQVLTDRTITTEIPIPEYTPYFSHGFSKSGNRFVSFSSSLADRLYLVDITRHKVDEIEVENIGKGVGQVKAVATDADAQWVALGGNGSGGSNNAVQIISLTARRETVRLVGHTGETYALAFTPDAAIVATGGSDLTVRLWQRDSGIEFLRLAGHTSDIEAIAVSPDGKMLATTASDGVVLLWALSDIAADRKIAMRQQICSEHNQPFTRPTVVLSVEERVSNPIYQGRPWNLCEWQGSGTPLGFIQSSRALLVRWAGIRFLDYKAP